jgi:hypothetical protein
MRIRIIKPVAAAALAAALVIVASPAPAHAAPGGNGTAQQASVTPSTIGALAAPFRLQNQKSGKLLQPLGGNQAVGTKVVQEPASGSGLQRWTIINDGDYISLENYTADKNMGIDGASTVNGASAIIANPDGSFNQDWKVLWKDNTWFRLQNRKSSRCLGISGASTSNHAVAAQFTCDNTTNQTWRFF